MEGGSECQPIPADPDETPLIEFAEASGSGLPGRIDVDDFVLPLITNFPSASASIPSSSTLEMDVVTDENRAPQNYSPPIRERPLGILTSNVNYELDVESPKFDVNDLAALRALSHEKNKNYTKPSCSKNSEHNYGCRPPSTPPQC